MTTPREELEQWLGKGQLTVPPLPEPLVSSLRRSSKYVWSSRAESRSPYDFVQHVEEALEPALIDHVLVAHAGHGTNSYAISYHLAWNGLRVLFQLAWGGAYMDPEATGARIREAFKRLHELWPLVVGRDRAARPQFLVASSDFHGGMVVRGRDELDRWGDDPGAHRALEHLAAELGAARRQA